MKAVLASSQHKSRSQEFQRTSSNHWSQLCDVAVAQRYAPHEAQHGQLGVNCHGQTENRPCEKNTRENRSAQNVFKNVPSAMHLRLGEIKDQLTPTSTNALKSTTCSNMKLTLPKWGNSLQPLNLHNIPCHIQTKNTMNTTILCLRVFMGYRCCSKLFRLQSTSV